MYLRWEDSIVGYIDTELNLNLTSTTPLSRVYFKRELGNIPSKLFKDFILERIISPNRRDVSKILGKMGLEKYDMYEIARKTKLINPHDLFWVSDTKLECYADISQNYLPYIFTRNVNEIGDSYHTPSGINKKEYGILNVSHGIYKYRLHNYSSDVESEVAVYKIAEKLGVPCCPAELVTNAKGETVVFSKYVYDFLKEYIVHARAIVGAKDFKDDEYTNLKRVFPEHTDAIRKMILLDFVTRQTDRHLSNYAFILSNRGKEFYPLYDNGRSLFFEDKPDFIATANNNIEMYASEFGAIGTYYDAVLDIAKETNIKDIVNLDIPLVDIQESYQYLPEERREGAVEWTYKTLQLLKQL